MQEKKKKILNFETESSDIYFGESQEKYIERIYSDMHKYYSSISTIYTHLNNIVTRSKEISKSFAEIRLVIEDMYEKNNPLTMGESDKLEIDALNCEIENIEKEFLDLTILMNRASLNSSNISMSISKKLVDIKKG